MHFHESQVLGATSNSCYEFLFSNKALDSYNKRKRARWITWCQGWSYWD